MRINFQLAAQGREKQLLPIISQCIFGSALYSVFTIEYEYHGHLELMVGVQQ